MQNLFFLFWGARDFPGPCQHHTRTTPCRDHTQHLHHNHPETVPAPYQNRAINIAKPHQSHTQAVPTRCQTNTISTTIPTPHPNRSPTPIRSTSSYVGVLRSITESVVELTVSSINMHRWKCWSDWFLIRELGSHTVYEIQYILYNIQCMEPHIVAAGFCRSLHCGH